MKRPYPFNNSFARFVEYLSLKEFVVYDVKKSYHSEFFLSKNHPHGCNVKNLTILILGDSINRHMVEDFCQKHNGKLGLWGSRFSYKVGAPPALCCQVGDLTIGLMNLYGAARTGPYLRNHTNTEEDPYADTELRIPNAIKQFVSRFGEPQMVIIRTEIWQLRLAVGVGPPIHQDPNNVIPYYIRNQTQNILQIRSLLPKSFIGTHTVPEIHWGMDLFHHFMNANCYLSQQIEDFFIFDWRLALLGKNMSIYLRDTHHPNALYAAAFTELIVYTLESWLCSQT